MGRYEKSKSFINERGGRVSLLSIGCNRKLGKKIGIFNLPAQKTCPGMTKYCAKVCYAMKAERCYKSAREKRIKNWDSSKSDNFVQSILSEIKKHKLIRVRIHESGDFYSQEYLDKWTEICTQCPDVTFLAYTKTFNLFDFSEKPDNMVIYYSLDSTSPEQPRDNKNQTCMIFEKKKDIPKGYYKCPPVSKNHHNYCGESCNVCWKGKKKVAWTKH